MNEGRDGHPAVVSAFTGSEFEAFRALHTVTKRLHASLDLSETLDAVAQGIVMSAGFRVAALSLFDREGFFEVVSVQGDAECRDALLGTRFPLEHWTHIETFAQRRTGAIFFVDSLHAPDWETSFNAHHLVLDSNGEVDAWQSKDALFILLSAPSGERIGLLSVDDPIDGRRPSEYQLEILGLFADHAALAIEHAHMHSIVRKRQHQLHHAATHDSLTGVSNRALLYLEGARMAAARNTHLAILLIDLDNFKAVNDTAGHASGDEVLIALAQRMRTCIREGDVLARIGGDEFVIVVTGHENIDVAVEALTRRIKEIASEPVETASGLQHVGASVGSAIAATPCDFSKMLSQADARMYDQKRAHSVRGSSAARKPHTRT